MFGACGMARTDNTTIALLSFLSPDLRPPLRQTEGHDHPPINTTGKQMHILSYFIPTLHYLAPYNKSPFVFHSLFAIP